MPRPPPRIQLLGRDNGAGLSRDMDLLAIQLSALGADVRTLGLPHRGRFAEWRTRWQWARQSPGFDLQIMLERLRPEFFGAARHNVLIPNPEYFERVERAALAAIDEVWCKTRHAEAAFAALGARCRYLGFASPDRGMAEIAPEPTFFHGPGRSNNKGTAALLALWGEHPDWPMLTVVWRRKRVELPRLPSNVRLIREHLDDGTYRELQQRHRFHLCPSQTEGYGHYIVEAMSCGAVVVTLDAPPMNELITPERGVLVAARAIGMQKLATTFGFDHPPMAAAIERCAKMPPAEAAQLGAWARRWFENNAIQWHERLRDCLASFTVRG